MKYLKTPLLLVAASLAISAQPVLASHHFETPIAIQVPAVNLLDNYIFQSSTPDNTAIVVSVNHSPKAGKGGVFKPDALYNVHIAFDDKYKTGHTYSFSFDDQDKVTVYDLNEPNAAPGKLGEQIASGDIASTLDAKTGVKIWTGAAEDPFFGNSPALHIYRAQLAQGKYDPSVWVSTKGTNIFAGRNSGALVLDIPNKQLNPNVHVFMTVDLKEGDQWKQVQYSANPLFSHVMLFENNALKQEHDQGRPTNSDDMKNFVSARTTRASGLAHSQKDPIAYGDKIANLLVPDVLTYQVGTPATYTVEKRNGRKLSDDAMSTMLSLLIGQPTDQSIEDQHRYTSEFPYVKPVTLK
ncbi:MAG: DUF4331 family protein [Vibrio sp.]